MIVRVFSGPLLRVFGFRRLLAGNACLAAAVTAACGLLHADTPVWLIVALLLLSGCVRSVQYLGLNAVSYADVPAPLLSKSTSVGGVAQQLARGFGVAVGAALLAVIAGPPPSYGRRFPARLIFDRTDPPLFGARLFAPVAGRRRRGQRPSPGNCS